MNSNTSSKRFRILAIGVFAMLFAGILYAWSILKVPFASELDFTVDALSLNFTFTMSFFCIGGVVSSRFVKLLGTKLTIILSGALAGLGFILTGFIQSGGIIILYLTYALISGFGIGVAYIVIISTVNSWFPDKKGLSSGALMMGFGASSLVLGNVSDALFKSEIGWRNTYIILGIALSAVLIFSAFFIKRPSETETASQKNTQAEADPSDIKHYTTTEMIRRFTFWRAFLCLVCVTAIGSSVISFARDLAISVGAGAALATTLVGVLSVFNGFGRIITGAVFDTMGRRFTMFAANIIAILAAVITLFAVICSSLPLCIIGLCLTGISYGTSPTIASAFVGSFYGQKHFASNLGVMNFNLMVASLIATACSALRTSTQNFIAPYILLLTLALISLALNFTIKKP